MSEFKEFWLVDNVDEMNQLINVGWRFIEVVYEPHKIIDDGFWKSKVVAIEKRPRYLMGRPDGILAREKEHYESLEDYVEKVMKETEK